MIWHIFNKNIPYYIVDKTVRCMPERLESTTVKATALYKSLDVYLSLDDRPHTWLVLWLENVGL